MSPALAYNLADDSVFESADIDDMESSPVKLAVSGWRQHCGTRRFPAREDLTPREIASSLRNMILVRVVERGADFENRIVGDSQVRAFSVALQNRRLSDIEMDAPALGTAMRDAFEQASLRGEPVALKIRVGRDMPEANFTDGEIVVLPLGADEVVDHLMVFATYAMRGVATYGI